MKTFFFFSHFSSMWVRAQKKTHLNEITRYSSCNTLRSMLSCNSSLIFLLIRMTLYTSLLVSVRKEDDLCLSFVISFQFKSIKSFTHFLLRLNCICLSLLLFCCVFIFDFQSIFFFILLLKKKFSMVFMIGFERQNLFPYSNTFSVREKKMNSVAISITQSKNASTSNAVCSIHSQHKINSIRNAIRKFSIVIC